MDARSELLNLNNKIPEAERNRDVAYLETILEQRLVFKRADGSIADKLAYLDSLTNEANTIQAIDQHIASIEFSKANDVAIVNTIVRFHGARAGKEVQGIFRNIRYFRKEARWKMFVWHNDKLSSVLHCLAMDDADSHYALNEKNEMDGIVYQQRSASLPPIPEMRAINVKFENGSHTKWHYHEGWQVLTGSEGVGFVQEKDAQTFDLSCGKRVLIPPFVWHRHGAKPGESMTHMAVTYGLTTWDFENKLEIV